MALGFRGLSGGLIGSSSGIMGSACNSSVGGLRKSWATCMTVGRLPVLGIRECLLGEGGGEQIGEGLDKRTPDDGLRSTGDVGAHS